MQVNGEKITRLGTTADPRNDRITVDGRSLSLPHTPIYLILHKPVGVVCTLKDPEGRPTVRALLKHVRTRVFPVGRLDYDSSGLLLLTNDGEFTERLLHPRYQIPRTYHAKVKETPSPEALQMLRNGVTLEDGTVTARATVQVLRITYRKAWLEITLHEGRNREVRRMCEAVGHPVDKLIRVRFGPLVLTTDLRPGAYRSLTAPELRTIKRMTQTGGRQPAPAELRA